MQVSALAEIEEEKKQQAEAKESQQKSSHLMVSSLSTYISLKDVQYN